MVGFKYLKASKKHPFEGLSIYFKEKNMFDHLTDSYLLRPSSPIGRALCPVVCSVAQSAAAVNTQRWPRVFYWFSMGFLLVFYGFSRVFYGFLEFSIVFYGFSRVF